MYLERERHTMVRSVTDGGPAAPSEVVWVLVGELIVGSAAAWVCGSELLSCFASEDIEVPDSIPRHLKRVLSASWRKWHGWYT